MNTYVINACPYCSTGDCCGGRVPKHSVAGVRAASLIELYNSIHKTVKFIFEHDGQIRENGEIISGFSFDWKEEKWTLEAECSTECYLHVLRDLLNRLMDPDPMKWSETQEEGQEDRIMIGGKELWVDFDEVFVIIKDTVSVNDIEDANAFC